VRRARRLGMSERRACGLIGSRRSTCRRTPRRGDAPGLREAPLRPSQERPRFGYRRLHVLLRRELPGINNKRVNRICRREALAMRRKQRRRLARAPRVSMPPASRPNECWSMDFGQDALESGRAFRTLNVVDVVTRMRLATEVDASLLQPSGHADRQPLHRELQRQVPRRVPEPALVRRARRRALHHRELEDRLQSQPAAQFAREPDPLRVRGANFSGPPVG